MTEQLVHYKFASPWKYIDDYYQVLPLEHCGILFSLKWERILVGSDVTLDDFVNNTIREELE